MPSVNGRHNITVDKDYQSVSKYAGYHYRFGLVLSIVDTLSGIISAFANTKRVRSAHAQIPHS